MAVSPRFVLCSPVLFYLEISLFEFIAYRLVTPAANQSGRKMVEERPRLLGHTPAHATTLVYSRPLPSRAA